MFNESSTARWPATDPVTTQQSTEDVNLLRSNDTVLMTSLNRTTELNDYNNTGPVIEESISNISFETTKNQTAMLSSNVVLHFTNITNSVVDRIKFNNRDVTNKGTKTDHSSDTVQQSGYLAEASHSNSYTAPPHRDTSHQHKDIAQQSIDILKNNSDMAQNTTEIDQQYSQTAQQDRDVPQHSATRSRTADLSDRSIFPFDDMLERHPNSKLFQREQVFIKEHKPITVDGIEAKRGYIQTWSEFEPTDVAEDVAPMDLASLKADADLLSRLIDYLTRFGVRLPTTLINRVQDTDLCPDNAQEGIRC